jgi:hypothetical protein
MKFQYHIVLSGSSLKEKTLTIKEFQDFKAEFPQIGEILLNPDMLSKKLSDMTKDLLEDWRTTALLILNSLWKFKGAQIFHDPVDPVKLSMN